MATEVFLANPETAIDNIVPGVANTVIESSFLVAVKVNLGTLVNDNGTTRAIKKQELIVKDDQTLFG